MRSGHMNSLMNQALGLSSGRCEIVISCPTGAAHLKSGTPCQDACLVSQQFYRGHPYTILVVADGHGHSDYTRSEVGAHIATEVARKVLAKFAQSIIEKKDGNSIKWTEIELEFKTHINKNILCEWREQVTTHAEDHPGDDVKFDTIESLRRYGTTLAVALIFDNMYFLGVIGDSAVYIVREDGEAITAIRFPPAEQGSIGLGTASLCLPDAMYHWNPQVIRVDSFEDNIVMILVTTDGLIDSLGKELESAIKDTFCKTKSNGINWLKKVWPEHLQHWSNTGVGDDMATIVFFPALYSIPKKLDISEEVVDRNENTTDIEGNGLSSIQNTSSTIDVSAEINNEEDESRLNLTDVNVAETNNPINQN